MYQIEIVSANEQIIRTHKTDLFRTIGNAMNALDELIERFGNETHERLRVKHFSNNSGAIYNQSGQLCNYYIDFI